jgi:hypothetical protein
MFVADREALFFNTLTLLTDGTVWYVYQHLRHYTYFSSVRGLKKRDVFSLFFFTLLKRVQKIAKSYYFGLEFITNLMHNFIYSMIILHHDPQHVSSIAVLIFRGTIVYLQYLVSSHCVCCRPVHRSRADCRPLLIGALDGSIQSVTIPDTVNIQLSP